MKLSQKLKLFGLGMLGGGLLIGMLWMASTGAHRLPSNLSESLLQRIQTQTGKQSQDISGANTYQRFDDVLTILSREYYTTGLIDTGAMRLAAIKAFVEGLGDPYTMYMDASETTGLAQNLKGSEDFEGIGAVISKVTDGVMIEQVINGSPAYKAGLMPLDLIIQVNQTGTKNLTVFDAVQMIRGPKNTTVELTIVRTSKVGMQGRSAAAGGKELIKKTITREKLSVPSVRGEIMTGGRNSRIGYIAITSIGEETETLLKQTINELSKQTPQGIVLDLRGNGGGLLPISVEVASHFIPEGKTIVESKFKSFPGDTYRSFGYGPFEQTPVVVLVDGLTASAGEIIALALKQQRNAVIIGTKTFGKGSIQTVQELDEGHSLKITVGRRYAPDGTNIDQEGITPDISVELDRESFVTTGKDPQLQRALEEIGRMSVK